MILCGIDVETTGLDPTTSEITEIAWAIFDTDDWGKPLAMASHILQINGEIPEDIVTLTKITKKFCKRTGDADYDVFQEHNAHLLRFGVNYMVAHNAPFDRSFLENKIGNLGYTIPNWKWIDTKEDIPYPKSIKNRNLVSLAAEHEFLNPFPHSALFDVFTMMKILSKYPIDDVIAYKNEPTAYLQALVTFDSKELAKKAGFSWQEINGVLIKEKAWVKALKARYLAEELEKKQQFAVRVLEG